MHREKFFVDVAASEGCDAPKSRRLLSLLATNGAPSPGDSNELAGGRRFRAVMVYLHGFPDVAVHPTKLDMASRLPFKLAEAWLQQGKGSDGDGAGVAFVAFNFGGVVGSDYELSFGSKTISQEVHDAVSMCEFVRHKLLQETNGLIHIVGISTGAIIGSLLRDKRVADTISVIAGLANLESGIRYDFSDKQMRQFNESGACWKEFYLPDECPLPPNAVISLNGQTAATAQELADLQEPPRKIYLQLHRRYLDECKDVKASGLDIREAVKSDASPFLVIHGDADQNVPIADGEQLFAAAAEPKQFLVIPKANHLLTNSRHLKKALQAILVLCSSATLRQR